MSESKIIEEILEYVAWELNDYNFTVLPRQKGVWRISFQTHDQNRSLGITMTLTHSLGISKVAGKWRFNIAGGQVFEADTVEKLKAMTKENIYTIVDIANSLKKAGRMPKI